MFQKTAQNTKHLKVGFFYNAETAPMLSMKLSNKKLTDLN